MKKRAPECNNWIADINRTRMKRDISKLFHIPYLSEDTEMCIHPNKQDMLIDLYDYQRKAIYRMMIIEDGIRIPLKDTATNLSKVYPRGGVVCEAVGMGKTIEMLGLILLHPCTTINPPHPDNHIIQDIKTNSNHDKIFSKNNLINRINVSIQQMSLKATLIICPEHLCNQWEEEINRITPNLKIFKETSPRLNSSLIDPQSQMKAKSLNYIGYIYSKLRNYDVILTSLDYIISQSINNLNSLSVYDNLIEFKYHRIILDECHDAIAQGTKITKYLSNLFTDHFWCVSGTPFPQGDDSAYGINQLLHINIKFIINNSIFIPANTYLPSDHPFEIIKQTIYIRNSPQSIEKDLAKKNIKNGTEREPEILNQDKTEKFSIEVFELSFSPIEKAFYDEEARHIFTRNVFSDSFIALRQLCCHPACSTKWMKRLTGVGHTATGNVVVSLDKLRSKMVKWKNEDIAALQRDICEKKHHIKYAINTIACIYLHFVALIDSKIRETLNISMEENLIERYETLSYSPSSCCRVKCDTGRFVFEHKPVKLQKLIRSFTRDEAKDWIQSNKDFILETREKIADIEKEIINNEKEVNFFSDLRKRIDEDILATAANENKVNVESVRRSDRLKSSSMQEESAFDESIFKYTVTDIDDESASTSTVNTTQKVSCFICLEQVTMIATANCGHWACDKCLFSWVNLHKNCPTCRKIIDLKDLSIVDLNVALSTDSLPIAPEIDRYGTKPWAVVEYCKNALDADIDNKMIIFSSYNEGLRIMSDTLSKEGISNLLLCDSTNDTLGIADTVKSFQSPSSKERVLLLNSNNSASGTNMQYANYVLFLEPSGSNPSHLLTTEIQCIGRTVRLGQSRHVNVAYFIMINTVEQEIYQSLFLAREETKKQNFKY